MSAVPSYEQIRNLLGRYTELMDDADFAGVGELFANGTLEDWDGNPLVRGAAEVEKMFANDLMRHDGRLGTKHVTTNVQIDVDEVAGTATARSAYVVFQATPSLTLQPVITGRYRDTFVRDDEGAWHFQTRRYGVDTTGDLSQHLRHTL